MDDKKVVRWLSYRENHIQLLIRRAGILFSLFIAVNAVTMLPMEKGIWVCFLVLIYAFYNWTQERRDAGFHREEYLIKLGLVTAMTGLGAGYTAILYQLILIGIILRTGQSCGRRSAFLVCLCYMAATFFAAYPVGLSLVMETVYNLLIFAVLTVGSSYVHVLVRRQMDNEQQMKELERENDRKDQMVLTDALTGLYNYRAYKEKIESVPQYALLVIDIDRFKKLNDTYGHGFGNKVLVKLGMIIRQSIRTGDMAFRYGGEEFVLLLPGANGTLGHKIAERLRQQVEASSFSHGKQEVPVTISIGISVKNPGTDSQTVFEQADSALYKAKQAGRNNVQWFAQELEMVCRL